MVFETNILCPIHVDDEAITVSASHRLLIMSASMIGLADDLASYHQHVILTYHLEQIYEVYFFKCLFHNVFYPFLLSFNCYTIHVFLRKKSSFKMDKKSPYKSMFYQYRGLKNENKTRTNDWFSFIKNYRSS